MKLKPYLHVIILFLVFVAALLLYGSWYGQVGKESADAAGLADQIQQRSQNSVRTQEARAELEHALSEESSIRDYFVNTADVVPFLESLQTTGTKLGSKVDVVSVSTQVAKPRSLLQLSLHITGPFDSVMRTIGAIEYQPYDTSVSSLTLDTTGGNGGTAGTWTAALTLFVGTATSTAQTSSHAASTTTATSTSSS